MVMNAWSNLPKAQLDPIFSVAMQARTAGPKCIDATIGVYTNEDGLTQLLPSAAQAMEHVTSQYSNSDFGYAPLLGLSSYRKAITTLVCPNTPNTTATCATAGGTGALALNLRLLKLLYPNVTLCLPTPSWSNHVPLCAMAQISFDEISVIENSVIKYDKIITWLKEHKNPSAVLLQVGCHNPTGIDMTTDQWTELIVALKETETIVLLDSAYQGFSGHIEEDILPVQKCIEADIPILISWSASKNHSVYRLRTGMALAHVSDEEMVTTVEEHYSAISRGLWSSAPAFGQELVACTQTEYQEQWLQDLANIRDDLQKKRSILQKDLPKSCRSSLNGRGMFAMLPLSKKQILTLREKHNVFLLDSGRINIAGIAKSRLSEFCEKIDDVVKN